jgi:hypothetical protein
LPARQRAARKVYRAITLAAVPLALVAAVPNEWVQRDPLIGIFTVVWMSVPLLIAPAVVIILVDQFMFSGKAGLWALAGFFMVASLLAAAWVGWLNIKGIKGSDPFK